MLGHAGAHLGGDLSGVLHAVFWLTALFGLWGALAYRVIPRRLSRLERSGALPEDLRGERERLVDRFRRELSGRSDLVKRAAKILLLPYALARGGWLALLLSGRDQRSERQLLQARVERLLGEQGSERLAGLEELVRTAVEIRAIPARRMLTALLRAFLPGHVVLTGLLLTLLAAHIVAQIGGIL